MGGGEVGGATRAVEGAWLSAASLVSRKSFSQELRIRWDGNTSAYCDGG